MRRLLAIVMLSAIFIRLQAQESPKKFQFGMRFSPNFTWLDPATSNYKNDGGKIGFGWGLVADIHIIDNYFLSTGFNLSYLSGKLSYPVDYQMTVDTVPYPVAVNGKLYRKLQFRYLEIPLLFKMKTKEFNNGIRYFGQMGLVPAFNLRTRADDVFYPDGGQSIKNSPDVSYSINSMKLSVDVGGGFEIPFDKSTFIMIGLTYSNGFTDLLGGYNNHPLVRAQEEAIQHYLELTFAIIF